MNVPTLEDWLNIVNSDDDEEDGPNVYAEDRIFTVRQSKDGSHLVEFVEVSE